MTQVTAPRNERYATGEELKAYLESYQSSRDTYNLIKEELEPKNIYLENKRGYRDPVRWDDIPFALREGQPAFEDFDLTMPLDGMYGRLGHLALTLDAPIGSAYLSLLTAYSARGVNFELPDHNRATLYTALIGKPAAGKSVVMRRAATATELLDRQMRTTVPSSDRGLINMFAAKDQVAPHQGSVLLLQDELKCALSKMAIENSTLAPTLCSLWYQDYASASVAAKFVEMYARISLLGAIPLEDPADFTTAFGATSLGGLYSRFLFVPLPDGWEPQWEWEEDWKEMRKPLIGPPVNCTIPRLIGGLVSEWQREKKRNGETDSRIGEQARRIAMIAGSANGDRQVGLDNIDAALRLMDWQLNVKKVYTPGRALNLQGQVAQEILAAFETNKKKNGYRLVGFSTLCRKHHWASKYGVHTQNALRALVSLGQLYEEADEDGRSTGMYCLAEDKERTIVNRPTPKRKKGKSMLP